MSKDSTMDERSRRIAKRFELPMLIAALLVIPVIAIEESDAGHPWRTLAAILNWGIWLAFAVELVVMLAVVPSKSRWLRRHPLEVVIVVVTVPAWPASLQAARVFRLLRLVRLLRLARLARQMFSFEGLRYANLLVGLTILAGGAAYAETENVSTWDGVWRAITTMTTLGYDEPHTDLGRLVTIGVLVVGFGFVAVLTGAIAERFLAARVEEVAEAAEEVQAADVDLLAELRDVRELLDRLEARLAVQPAPRRDL